jgi:hypothetical protein
MSVAAACAAIFISGCNEEVMAANSSYMRDVAASFKIGMAAEDVRSRLKQLGAFSDIYNVCLKEFEARSTPCDQGYNLVTTTRLPHHSGTLGRGDGQMYFTFDPNGALTTFEYEIYYEAHH